MFIIDKGRCVGTQTTEKGKLPIKSRDYREGDIIGEGALLKPEKRQENIIANSDIVKFICLDRFSFKQNFGSLELRIEEINKKLKNLSQKNKSEYRKNKGKLEAEREKFKNRRIFK